MRNTQRNGVVAMRSTVSREKLSPYTTAAVMPRPIAIQA
jgi:hypothetical protein